jgi:hypothetical protein
MARAETPMELAALPSPSADTSRRWSVDQHLRRHGFTIASRVPGQEPRWRRKGKLYVQQQAVEQAAKDG